jgi:DNA replication and repair protein RecF
VPGESRNADGGEPDFRAEVRRVRARGFRNLAPQELWLRDGITLLWGPNGAGKTNVLEAIAVALSGRSCRTRNERETLAFGERLARVEVDVEGDRGCREFMWSLGRDGERRHLVDGATASADHVRLRPALAVFLPDRLALVKGPPAIRRSHLDRLVAALWPSRADARRSYGRALAQRNALLGRVRAGTASKDSLAAWDSELARAGVELIDARRRAAEALAAPFAAAASELGVPGEAAVTYTPRSQARVAGELEAELGGRREADLARGHSTHGPHLDEVAISLDGRSVRSYGSQGEQRATLLALLFAERRALLEAQRTPPLMLLDDVMSELDPDRRALLARGLGEGAGQTLITATEPDQLPSGCERAEIALRCGEAVVPSGPPARDHPSPALAG